MATGFLCLLEGHPDLRGEAFFDGLGPDYDDADPAIRNPFARSGLDPSCGVLAD
jgi:hypothetical protein